MLSLDLVTIIIFSLIVVISGLVFSGSGKSMKSFFAGGGAVPWWISSLSLFMSFFSAGTFVVWGAIAYNSGWVAVTIQWTMCIAGFIIGFVVAPKWQKTGVLTVAEFITKRLGYNTQKIYSYLFLLISLFTTGAFLYPVAKILQVYTGVPIHITTILIGLLILVYTAVGGMWAVVVTDVLQFVVLTAAVLIVVPIAFDGIGGVKSFIHQSPDEMFKLFSEEYSPGFIIAFGLYNLFFLSGNWAYIQRYTTVKDSRSAKKVGWLFGALYFISPIIWMLPPMIYRIMNPGLTNMESEGAYLLICKEVLPAGMMGLMLAGMVFATSSSVNTTLNISAGVLTNDLYKPIYPKSSQKRLVNIARVTTIILGLLTIGMALMVPYLGGIVEVVISLGALTGAAMYLPPLWALYSKKQTGASVLTVTLLSLVINLFFKFITPWLFNFSLSRSTEMIVGVGVPILFLAIHEWWISGSLQSSTAYEKYFRIMKKHYAKGESVVITDEEEAENAKGKKVITIGILITGFLIAALGIYAIQTSWIVWIMGCVVIFIGLIIYPRKKANLNKVNNKKRVTYVDES